MSAFKGAKVMVLRVPGPPPGCCYTLNIKPGDTGIVDEIGRSEQDVELAAVSFRQGAMWIATVDLEVIPV